MIKLKRVYESPSKEDGERILVERLWPRGLTKERAKIDQWLKDIAPSQELRQWYGHDPDKWNEFRKRYWRELVKNKDLVQRLKQSSRGIIVTLVYAARDEPRTSAHVLKDYLSRRE